MKAGFFSLQNVSASSNLGWFGLAVLVGFGTQDFLERLRLLSGTLFGIDKGKSPAAKGDREAAVRPSEGDAEPGADEETQQPVDTQPGESGGAPPRES